MYDRDFLYRQTFSVVSPEKARDIAFIAFILREARGYDLKNYANVHETSYKYLFLGSIRP